MPLQELMESFLGVDGGNNITGEALVVTNVVKQLFGIMQDLCFGFRAARRVVGSPSPSAIASAMVSLVRHYRDMRA